MQEDIFSMLEIVRVPFSQIEGILNMPKNYLSRFKNPENKMPEKWIKAMSDYLEKEFEIEVYCKENNCTKKDLIELHKKYKDHNLSDLKEIAKTERIETKIDQSNTTPPKTVIKAKEAQANDLDGVKKKMLEFDEAAFLPKEEKVDYHTLFEESLSAEVTKKLWEQMQKDPNVSTPERNAFKTNYNLK